MEKSLHDAAVEYLTAYTKSFDTLEEGTSFYLNATEKHTIPQESLYVGYKHENGTVTVAWGNPQNRFMMHGSPAVLLCGQYNRHRPAVPIYAGRYRSRISHLWRAEH
jgi:hypothetical protein